MTTNTTPTTKTAAAGPRDGFTNKHGAAAYLSLSQRTLDELRYRGELACYKVSARKVLFRFSDLDAFMESRKVG